MKKFTDILKNGCCIFTGVTLLFYSVGGIISGADRAYIPSLKTVWLFFAFSLLLSFANELLRLERLNAALRLAVHFVSCLALYFITVIVCGGYIKNGSQTLVALFLFLIVYIAFAVIYLLLSGRKKKPKKKYKSQF